MKLFQVAEFDLAIGLPTWPCNFQPDKVASNQIKKPCAIATA